MDAAPLTLGHGALAGQMGSMYMMLTARDAVGLAACQIHLQFRSDFLGSWDYQMKCLMSHFRLLHFLCCLRKLLLTFITAGP